jgi:hypothetical protein
MLRRATSRVRFARGSILLAALGGCGRGDVPPVVDVYEVKGRVVLRDGRPLTKGRIAFVPTQTPYLLSSAVVERDGTFSLTTGDSGPGAPVGQFKVRVEPDGPPPIVQGGRGQSKTLPFPSKYLDEDSSGLRVTVKPEPNHLAPFVLE